MDYHLEKVGGKYGKIGHYQIKVGHSAPCFPALDMDLTHCDRRDYQHIIDVP